MPDHEIATAPTGKDLVGKDETMKAETASGTKEGSDDNGNHHPANPDSTSPDSSTAASNNNRSNSSNDPRGIVGAHRIEGIGGGPDPSSEPISSNGDNGTSLPPGAYHVETSEDPRQSGGGGGGGDGTINTSAAADAVIEADTIPVHEAYTVEEGEAPQEARVIKTICGIDRKRFFILSALVIAAIAIILGATLGTTSNRTKSDVAVCGPICSIFEEGEEAGGQGGGGDLLPFPDRRVFGKTCAEWQVDATTIPLQEDGEEGLIDPNYCAAEYSAVALSCGCPSVPIPTDHGCGTLCQDGSEITDPDMFFRDIHYIQLTCRDFESKSLFEKDDTECPNYNAIGAVCGCKANTPHPDACGPLCGLDSDPDSDTVFKDTFIEFYATYCHHWDIFSSYLPQWYNNPNGETCSEYYADVAHGCACKSTPRPPEECNTLCKQNRKCPTICQDGSEVPDLMALAHNTDCLSWEYLARAERFAEVCPYYDMVGAQCGCENNPPENACGPLCTRRDPATNTTTITVLPDPSKVVQGKTCEDWDAESRFLFEGYGYPNPMFDSCEEKFGQVAFGCGCFEDQEIESVCGSICPEGETLVDPDYMVDDISCGDLDFFAIFETYPDRCVIYEVKSEECRCTGDNETTVENKEPECFDYRHSNQYYYAPYATIAGRGTHAYVVQLGEGGYIGQIGGGGYQGDVYVLGWQSETDDVMTYDNSTGIMKITYGGGTPCRIHGPRSTKISIKADTSVLKPTISAVYEPAICVYQVEMKVPSFCEGTV